MMKATGRSAKILAETKKAIAMAEDCPCGRQVLADLRNNRSQLKWYKIHLCKKGHQKPWLQLLIATGVVWWTNGYGHRSVTIYLEAPIIFALKGK